MPPEVADHEALCLPADKLQAACDAACTILSIDETVKNQSSYDKGGIDGTGAFGE